MVLGGGGGPEKEEELVLVMGSPSPAAAGHFAAEIWHDTTHALILHSRRKTLCSAPGARFLRKMRNRPRPTQIFLPMYCMHNWYKTHFMQRSLYDFLPSEVVAASTLTFIL